MYSMKLQKLGGLHGWTMDVSALSAESIIYDFGVSNFIEYDLELIAKFGCTIHAFDPDPKSAAWIATQELPPQFIFHPYGLASFDGNQKFYDPYKKENINVSSIKKNKTFSYLPVKKLSTIMRELGHTHVNLLKIDIEGSEFSIIPSLRGRVVDQLCIEMHSRFFRFSFLHQLIARSFLYLKGFRAIFVLGNEYTFIS